MSPYYLLGLFGLAVPLIIHFWSRRNPDIIPFGSIRFLPDAHASRSMSWLLTDKRLLLVRLAMLSLLSLILARPAFRMEQDPVHRILIDPAVADHEKVRQLTDTTQSEVVRIPRHDTDTWSILREAARDADSLTLITEGRIANFRGKRPTLNIPVGLITVEPDISEARNTLITFNGKSGRSHRYDVISSPASQTMVRATDGTGNTPENPLMFQLISGGNVEQERIIKDALEAISDYLDYPFEIRITDRPEGNADWFINLSENDFSDGYGGLWINQESYKAGPVLLPGKNGGYVINGILSPDRVREERFLSGLLAAIDPFGTTINGEALEKEDRRLMTSEILPVRADTDREKIVSAKVNTTPFWVILLLLFCIERIMSFRKNA